MHRGVSWALMQCNSLQDTCRVTVGKDCVAETEDCVTAGTEETNGREPSADVCVTEIEIGVEDCVTDFGDCVTEPDDCVTDVEHCVTELDDCVTDVGDCVTEPNDCVTDVEHCVTEPGDCVPDVGNCVTEPDGCVSCAGEFVDLLTSRALRARSAIVHLA